LPRDLLAALLYICYGSSGSDWYRGGGQPLEPKADIHVSTCSKGRPAFNIIWYDQIRPTARGIPLGEYISYMGGIDGAEFAISGRRL